MDSLSLFANPPEIEMLQPHSTRLLYSPLAADPDLSDLVEQFVAEIANRISALNGFAESADWGSVSRLAHQIKGAAGSYGFHDVTSYAMKLEHSAKAGDPDNCIREALAALAEICSRLRSGMPEGAAGANSRDS